MLGEHLDGDRAVQAGVAGFVDLTHPPSAEGGDDLIRSERGARREGHGSGHRNALFEFLEPIEDHVD